MASTGAAGGTAGAAAAGAVRTVIRAMNPYWRPQRNERQAAKLYHRNLARAQGGTDGNGKPLYTPYTWNVVKGDLVQVTTTSRKRDKDNKGKHLKNADGSFVAEDWLGAQGVVLKVLRKQERIIVKGVNMRTRVAQVRTQTQQRRQRHRRPDTARRWHACAHQHMCGDEGAADRGQ